MRVLQLIDSLDAGGAERVAVNFANLLADKVDRSFICATRKEGILKQSINKNVEYLFLNKSVTLDFSAISKLIKYVKSNKIDVIHAHSSSFFLATIIKFSNSEIKIVWHDHYGNSEFLHKRKSSILKFCSKYFSCTFSVNRDLEKWAKTYFKLKNVTYLPNFAVIANNKPETILKGVEDKRIVCLANLRPQKDHETLINAFIGVVKYYPEWTLHCIGKDFNDEYSLSIKNQVKKLNLTQNIYFYGSKPDVNYILNQCEIGLLSSKSEGLPIALLEYGLCNLAVIATKVGECEQVIEADEYGILIDAEDSNQLRKALLMLIKGKEKRDQISKSFHDKIKTEYSSEVIIAKVIDIYSSMS